MTNPKQIVSDGYDTCARAYAAARLGDPSPELEILLSRLKSEVEIMV